jgi:hypothetical protein
MVEIHGIYPARWSLSIYPDSANHNSEHRIREAEDNPHARAAILNDTVPAYLGDRGNLAIDTVTPAQSHEFGDAIREQFQGGSTFREGEEIPINTYTVTGNMTQFRVTSYGESGTSFSFMCLLPSPTHPSRPRYFVPCHRQGSSA